MIVDENISMALEYILDGYNVIKCDDALADLSLEEGRKALLRILSVQRPHGSPRNTVVVVFDGKKDVWGPHEVGIAKVIFTSGETADEYIKRYVEHKSDAVNAVVVTNDGEICCYVRKFGAKVLSVKAFLRGASIPGKRVKAVRGVKIDSRAQKQISRTEQKRINDELESIWIPKDS